jgi:hypothetical protein
MTMEMNEHTRRFLRAVGYDPDKKDVSVRPAITRYTVVVSGELVGEHSTMLTYKDLSLTDVRLLFDQFLAVHTKETTAPALLEKLPGFFNQAMSLLSTMIPAAELTTNLYVKHTRYLNLDIKQQR